MGSFVRSDLVRGTHWCDALEILDDARNQDLSDMFDMDMLPYYLHYSDSRPNGYSV